MKPVHKMLRIGILGGTFDPIHRAHLELAKSAKRFLKLDVVYFVPAKISPFKKHQKTAPATLRLKMIRLATKGNRWVKVSDIELKRPGVSYTINTLKYFRKKYRRKACFYLIMGADAFTGFPKWRKSKEIARLAKIVVANRSGGGKMPSWPHIRIPMKKIELSSSGLRKQLKMGTHAPLGLIARSIPISKNSLKNLLKKKNFLHNYLTS